MCPPAGAVLPEPGTEVTAVLDWDRRHRLMRMHTSMHLLCSLIPGAGVTGGQIGVDKSRLDFDLPEPPTKEALTEKLNALVAANHAVTDSWISDAELDANPGMVRTLSVQPPRGSGRIRLVRIGGDGAPVDLQPCGGTHVRAHRGDRPRRSGQDREQGQGEPARDAGARRGVRRMEMLVSTEWLAAELGKPDLVVFDCSTFLPGEPGNKHDAYRAARIPGALLFDIDRIADDETDLPHMVPTPAKFARMVGALGVSNDTRVVFYDQHGLRGSPRGWWMMRLFGHDKVAVLDGGLPAWKKEGRAIETGDAAAPAPATFVPDFRAGDAARHRRHQADRRRWLGADHRCPCQGPLRRHRAGTACGPALRPHARARRMCRSARSPAPMAAPRTRRRCAHCSPRRGRRAASRSSPPAGRVSRPACSPSA